MNQPSWKKVGQLGDKDIVGCGGAIVVVDSREFTEPNPERGVYHWIQQGSSKYAGAGTCYDTDPRYPPEMWVIEEPVEFADSSIVSLDDLPDAAEWKTSVVILSRMKWVSDEGVGYLVPYGYQSDWPHAPSAYVEWWMNDIENVSTTIGASTDDLVKLACSAEAMELAQFYESLVGYYGAFEFDQYPVSRDRAGIEAFVKEWGTET